MIERPGHLKSTDSKERTYSPERDGRIEVEGDPMILSILAKQAENVRQGEEDPNVRIALFILPGGIRGVTSGGQVTALGESGLTNGFNVVVGGSTGAHVAAWLLAGDPRLGTTIFSEECASKNFIDLKRIPDGHGMDVEYLSQVYRGETSNKVLDIERIRAAHPDFRIALTEYYTGKSVLVDGKNTETIDAIQASSAAGPMYTKPIYIGDTRYGDASAGAYFPVKDIVDEYDPTHIVVLPNRSKDLKESATSRLLDRTLSASLPAPYRDAWLAREQNFNEGLEDLRSSGVPYVLFWSDNAVAALTREPETIRAAAARSEEHMRTLLEASK
ncbi:MAG: hypothetical protein QG636_519 [Patescibacteria group bacterium]|jgi:predicted patatin/cPLA2 family phospholipase|nr:hypothetical protein [Patescibacteria group bacterium]